MNGHLVFETELGFVAISWSEHGLRHLALPQAERSAAKASAERWRDAGPVVNEADAPPFAAEAIALIRAYAAGETVDFTALPLDLDGIDPFRRAIYAAALRLGHGETATYGELSTRAGFLDKARETGQALGRNPLPLVVPCHRVLAAGNRPGGFSAPGGVATKLRLLDHEQIRLGAHDPTQGAFPF
jgi:methylated-DNA-[protein]-cysteine S-methyltransferase